MKGLIYVVGLFLFVVAVSALDVDCGHGNSVCRENDLKDEFNNLDDRMIQAEDYDVEQITRLSDVETFVGETWEYVGEVDNKVSDLEDKDIDQDFRLENVEQKDRVQDGKILSVEQRNIHQDKKINSLKGDTDYFYSKESLFLEDKVGGGGISENHLASRLVGDKNFFDTSKGFSTYQEYADLRYAPLNDFQILQDKYRMLEMWAISVGYMPSNELELECAKIYGRCGKTQCFPELNTCIRNVE
jgi:hypothetical protein